MAIVLKLLSAYTMLVALLVAVKFIFAIEQPTWTVMNWLMAAAILITMAGAINCKLALEKDGDAGQDLRRSLDVNVPFYAAAALLIAFAFQWSATLNDHVQLAVMADGEEMTIGSMWAYIDTLYIIVTGMIGVRMWNGRWPGSA
ncbi:MAG: hypothetical protein OXL97_05105 [Chloroflexota bacterium]|nr:hypothetical protein [Chloroflexota bacterium]MDE2884043.1 hypothetical protein [Chloroflexota bacterium]